MVPTSVRFLSLVPDHVPRQPPRPFPEPTDDETDDEYRERHQTVVLRHSARKERDKRSGIRSTPTFAGFRAYRSTEVARSKSGQRRKVEEAKRVVQQPLGDE